MSSRLAEEEIRRRLLSFVRGELLPAPAAAEFEAQTPLLESGLLDSVGSARLLNFIQKEFDLVLPMEEFTIENFRDVRSIAALVRGIDA